MKNLRVGGSGKYAHYVLPALKAHGGVMRALVTREDKREEALTHGADEVAVGDLRDEESLTIANG